MCLTFCFKIYLRQDNYLKVTVKPDVYRGAKFALALRSGPSPRIWKWCGGRDHRILKVRDGDLPGEWFWILSVSICVFNELMSLDQISIVFNTSFRSKRYSLTREKPSSGQNLFQTVTILHVSLTLFHLHVQVGFTFSTDLVALRRLIFSKWYTSF